MTVTEEEKRKAKAFLEKDLTKKQDSRNLQLTVNTKGIEDLMERAKEYETDAKGFRGLATDLAESMREQGIQIDSTQIKPENFKENVKRLYEEKAKTEQTLQEMEERETDFEGIGHGGAGSVGLKNGQQSSGKKTFGSREEMVDYLLDQESLGNPEAKETLNKLTHKVLKGLKDSKETFQFEPEGGIVEKYNEIQNQRIQKKLKEMRD